MDRAQGIAKLIADLELCLADADALGLSLAGVFICQAIEKLKLEPGDPAPRREASAHAHSRGRA